MNIAMLPIEIVGLKKDLPDLVRSLREAGVLHIEALADMPLVSARPLSVDREMLKTHEEQNFLLARIEGMLSTLGLGGEQVNGPEGPVDLDTIRSGVERLLPDLQNLVAQREKLHSELASLPRYENTLRQLLPIIPPAAREPGRITAGVLADRIHIGVLDALGKQILDLTSGQAEIVATDVDAATRAMLIIYPEEYAGEVENLLGRENVSRLRLPAQLGEGPPDAILASLHRRMEAIPGEISRIGHQLENLGQAWRDRLVQWRAALREEEAAHAVLSHFGETDTTFVLIGWVPENDIPKVEAAMHAAVGERIFLHRLAMTPELKHRAPVVLQNPSPAQPFESLVTMLALPRYGHIDPTQLMAFFLPIFFGMILGDVGYGLLLILVSLLLRRRIKKGIMRDVLTILAMGSACAIVFGFLYGEAFGTLGESFGLHPLWIDRMSPEQVSGLLVMTLAVGTVHIFLGLVLGLWEAFKERSRNHLLERGGMLTGLISLLLIVAVVNDALPEGLMTPSVAGLVIGIVLLGIPLGWLGVLMGPIEFIGLIGNILSYLRIAAIGLASVYLAMVANDVAGKVGNLLVGIIVAVLIHALNLVLGAFSPTIHSLRLHYVEFFRKFYEGGGRPYRPFGRV